MIPAFANIWAMGLFANCGELVGVNGFAYLLLAFAAAYADS